MPDDLSLQKRRLLPPDGQATDIVLSDGWRLRAHVWTQGQEGRPALLFCGGRGDFIEKYCESFWHWRARGHAMMAFDMRGYGLSGRASVDAERDYQQDFARLVEDYAEVYAQAHKLLNRAPVPIAHSMGGHILLRWLADCAPSVVRAILLSPMLGIGSAPRTWALAQISAVMRKVQGADHWAFGQGGYDQDRTAHREKILTGSPERYRDEGWWIAQEPRLRMGGVSWGWLHAATRSIAHLATPDLLEHIPTRLCFLMGSEEKLVDAKAAARMARRLPHACYHILPRGRHELLRDCDDVQHKGWHIIDEFLEDAR